MAKNKFDSMFKAQVALEAIKDCATLAALSSKYGVHSSQIHAWKTLLKERAASIFSKNNNFTEIDNKRVAELERKIGQLIVENDFLRKKSLITKKNRRLSDDELLDN